MTIFTRTAAFIYSYNLSLSVAEQKYTFFDFCMFFPSLFFYFVHFLIFHFILCLYLFLNLPFVFKGLLFQLRPEHTSAKSNFSAQKKEKEIIFIFSPFLWIF